MITTIKQFAEAVKPLMKDDWSVSAIISSYSDPQFKIWDSYNSKFYDGKTPEATIAKITDSAKELDMVITDKEEVSDENPFINF